MTAYIQQLLRKIESRFQKHEVESDITSHFAVVVEELNRLDPRDFLQAAQADFVDLRRRARRWAGVSTDDWKTIGMRSADHSTVRMPDSFRQVAEAAEFTRQEIRHKFGADKDGFWAARELCETAMKLCQRLAAILDGYAGVGSQAAVRSFAFVADADVRSIVERDYKDLSLILYPGHAWKATVVMAGSILEAILYDQLTQSQTRVTQAMASSQAPTKVIDRSTRATAVRNISSDRGEDQWTLDAFIKVCVDLTILAEGRAKTIDQTLRDYRNFVHPRKELRSAHSCKEAEAMCAMGSLMGVCDHLEIEAAKAAGAAPP